MNHHHQSRQPPRRWESEGSRNFASGIRTATMDSPVIAVSKERQARRVSHGAGLLLRPAMRRFNANNFFQQSRPDLPQTAKTRPFFVISAANLGRAPAAASPASPTDPRARCFFLQSSRRARSARKRPPRDSKTLQTWPTEPRGAQGELQPSPATNAKADCAGAAAPRGHQGSEQRPRPLRRGLSSPAKRILPRRCRIISTCCPKGQPFTTRGPTMAIFEGHV